MILAIEMFQSKPNNSMCLHRSFIVTESEQVFSCPDNDHHTQIIQRHHLDDQKKWPGIKEPVFIEYNPVDSLLELDKWHRVFDNTTGNAPMWWTNKHQSKLLKTLEEDHVKYTALDSTYIFPGALDLQQLRCVNRAGVTIIATGSVRLGACILPPDTTIISKNGSIVCEDVVAHPNCSMVAPAGEVRFFKLKGMSMSIVDKSFLRRREHFYRKMDDRYDAIRAAMCTAAPYTPSPDFW